jgi:predicted kinase
MNTLLMMVGLPRSGKSTWARAQGIPIVNPDAIRLALHGQDFVGEAEPMVWTMARYMVRALFLAGHTRIILDATNTTKRRRDEWRSSQWELRYVPVPTSEATCIERAVAANNFVLKGVIERMARSFEPLTPEELTRAEPALWWSEGVKDDRRENPIPAAAD